MSYAFENGRGKCPRGTSGVKTFTGEMSCPSPAPPSVTLKVKRSSAFRRLIHRTATIASDLAATCSGLYDVLGGITSAGHCHLGWFLGRGSFVVKAGISRNRILRYDTIDDLHWKTDRQAASLI